jgi:hypothetical protein
MVVKTAETAPFTFLERKMKITPVMTISAHWKRLHHTLTALT